jgi:hypothetical protein
VSFVRSRRLRAALSLVAYLATALLYPELHRLHHARFGADHVHGALGTVFFHGHAAGAAEPSVFDHHRAFDLDWASLDLADVAHAGTLTVDCSLAAYTGVECSDAHPEHEHNFGDELLAREHAHAPAHAPDVDPAHGAGSLEHLAASLLTARPIALPPPASSTLAAFVAARPVTPALATRRTQPSRGPPAAC